MDDTICAAIIQASEVQTAAHRGSSQPLIYSAAGPGGQLPPPQAQQCLMAPFCISDTFLGSPYSWCQLAEGTGEPEKWRDVPRCRCDPHGPGALVGPLREPRGGGSNPRGQETTRAQYLPI